MIRRITACVVMVTAALLLSAGSCDNAPSERTTPQATPGHTASGYTAGDYELLLSVLAENGWVVTDDDKLVGTAHHVQSVINGCIIGLRLVRARPVTYRATAVNGHSPDYFGDKAEQLLGVPNPIQSDFANALAQLQADGVIPDC